MASTIMVYELLYPSCKPMVNSYNVIEGIYPEIENKLHIKQEPQDF